MAFVTWRDTVANLVPGWLQGIWGERLVGIIGLQQDLIAQGLSEAIRAPWLKEDSSPNDALPLSGNERAMARYPYETDDQYRARLNSVWELKPFLGTGHAILEQLAIIGLPATIHPQREWAREPVLHPVTGTPWWSKFVIVIRNQDVFGPAAKFGDGSKFGDGTLFGVSGDPAIVEALRGIINSTRASHEICPEVLVQDGILFGDGHTFGDGSVFGGEVISISTL